MKKIYFQGFTKGSLSALCNLREQIHRNEVFMNDDNYQTFDEILASDNFTSGYTEIETEEQKEILSRLNALLQKICVVFFEAEQDPEDPEFYFQYEV